MNRHQALAAACLLVLAAQCARGLEPQKTESIVYRLQAFAATEYALVYSAPQADTVYLIADSENAFDPRSTLVYYWPLTREYFQSWEKLDVPVDGSLEVLSGTRVVKRTQRVDVVFSYAHATAQGQSVLCAGPRAREVREAFEGKQKEYERQMERYTGRLLEYRRALRKYMQESSRASSDAPLPREPVEPVAPDLFVSEPQSAYVVNLGEGSYTLRMVDDEGNVIEGSERRVVAFRPLQTNGTGYQIIPEERWTARVQADTPGDGLFCAPGRDLYLVAYATETYRRDQYARLRNPQSQESSQGTVQVPVAGRDTGRLVVTSGGKARLAAQSVPYYVKQKSGPELGYSIVEWSRQAAGADGPTFSAYRLSFDARDAGRAYHLGIEDPVSGGILAGSERSLRVIDMRTARLPWLFTLVPVIIGACVILWRKRKV